MKTGRTITMSRSFGANAAAVLAMKAAVSALVQRRNGAREPVRDLYYKTHSLLRALRQHLAQTSAA